MTQWRGEEEGGRGGGRERREEMEEEGVEEGRGGRKGRVNIHVNNSFIYMYRYIDVQCTCTN